ncbi:phage holin family protein [Nonomuraea pusilla]|uniref:Putative Holin-X, holin superfamily III n=1 Tax=Nonomuraea pusilla TaxID=46177 RepID=A0A1H7QSE7_9ACTN|nr:phage holin family protein [Nonomuraea pusilla]SEL50809.1 Putative Holin-X, holin superfamily III [Nonomuraea pusilla]
MPQTPEEESLGALVAEASSHISTLVRSEIELAKAELRFDAKRVGTAVGMFAAAAFIGHLCLILLSFAAAYGLAYLIPTPLAFLVVTVVYLVIAGLGVWLGVRKLKGLAGMKRTARSIRDLKEIATPEGSDLPEPVNRDAT